VPKRRKVGQRDTSERSQEPGTCGTEGLVRPHGMLVPYFGRTRLGQGPAGMRKNKTKKETRWGQDYLMLLDIMAKGSYLLQETIYSNRQTVVSYYNRTRIGQRRQGGQ